MSSPHVTDILHAAISRAARGTDRVVHNTIDRTRTAAHTTVDRGADFMDRGRQRTIVARRSVARTVRERPMTSLAVAAGLGALLGMSITRVRRRPAREE